MTTPCVEREVVPVLEVLAVASVVVAVDIDAATADAAATAAAVDDGGGGVAVCCRSHRYKWLLAGWFLAMFSIPFGFAGDYYLLV